MDPIPTGSRSLATAAEMYAREVLDAIAVERISDSNNHVYRVVDSAGRRLAMKVMVDDEVDLDVWTKVECALRSRVPLADTVRIDRSRTRLDHDVVVSKYLDGEDLASFVMRNGFRSIERKFAELSSLVLDACTEIPPPRPGYGPYKYGKPMYASPEDYYRFQTEKFISRISRTGAALPKADWGLLERRMTDRFLTGAARKGGLALVPVDVNLKNFVVLRSGELAVLNIPIFSRAAVAHGVASFVFQTRGQETIISLGDFLLERFTQLRRSDLSLFEAYNAIGVLAFYARKGSAAIHNTPMWGSRRPLFDVLLETAAEAEIL